VKVRPNRRYKEFVARLALLSGRARVRWRGITFRSVDLAYAAPAHVLSGEGSLKAGGRWNAPGAFPAIYSSTRPGTAIEEAFQLAADFQLAPDDLKPRVTCGIEWDLASVLDLTTATLPGWLKLSDWMRENFTHINDGGFETLCQAFGRAARNSGITGILCPSVRVKGGINLVVFRDRMRKTEVGRVLGETELNKYMA
jgi:RES domain-containing protein